MLQAVGWYCFIPIIYQIYCHNMDDCLFCKIIAKGEVPSTEVYEDADTYAFLDINPNNPGHTLVVPKAHYTNLYDISDDALCAVMKTVRKIALSIKKAVGATGVNIAMNNERDAGQIIDHAHIHIIPRFKDDGFRHWPGTPYKDGEIEKVARKIRAELSAR